MEQKPTGSHLDAKSVERYDVTKTLWCHSFFSVTGISTNLCYRFCFLYTLYLSAFVSKEKDVSCLSLWGFCILVTWLTKYGHDYQNWQLPLKEQTWTKIKPTILKEPKIRRLEGICSNHFVVRVSPHLFFTKKRLPSASPSPLLLLARLTLAFLATLTTLATLAILRTLA